MVARRRCRILVWRRHADEIEERRHHAAVVGVVLGTRDERHHRHFVAAGHSLQRGNRTRGERRIVHDHGIGIFAQLEFDGGALRGGDAFCSALDAVDDLRPDRRVERAEGADHLDRLGNDVVADATLDRADRDHRGVPRDVDLAAHDRLHRAHDLRCRDDGIDAVPGSRAVGLPALHDHLETVRRRHQRAFAITDQPRIQRRPQVQPEHGIGLGGGEQPFVQHQARAAALTVGRAFFGRLEHEHHRAGQLGLHARQDFCRSEQDSRVPVVAAGMHDAHLLAAVFGRRHRLERHVHLLGDGQCVHVGAQRDRRTGLAAAQDADHACVRDAGSHFEPHRAQLFGHDLGGADFAVAEFRVLVEVAAPGEDLRHGSGRGRLQVRVADSGPGGARSNQEPQQ